MSILAKLERAIDKRILSETQFRQLLKRQGFKPGAVVMVHASFDEIVRRVAGMTAPGVADLIKDLLSPGGTLLMPAVQTNPIAEAFCLSPGVFTSIHPTDPVAAWGKHARTIISTHHLGGTFDTFSPFYKLCEHRGIVCGIGGGLESFSIVHVAEELHPATRVRVFEKDVRIIRLLENIEPFEYAYRALRPDVAHDYDRLERALLKCGTLRYSDEGGLQCSTMGADAFLRQSTALLDVGHFL